MQVCLPKHNYKLDYNLLTVEPRAVDPHCFDADPYPDPTQNIDADPDPDPGGRGDRSDKNVHPPWQNPRYAPASVSQQRLKIRVLLFYSILYFCLYSTFLVIFAAGIRA